MSTVTRLPALGELSKVEWAARSLWLDEEHRPIGEWAELTPVEQAPFLDDARSTIVILDAIAVWTARREAQQRNAWWRRFLGIAS